MRDKKRIRSVFGARLKEIRENRGLSQLALAKAARTTQALISVYETSRAQPTAAVLARIAKALHTSADELLGLRRPTLAPVDKEKARLWKKFCKLTTLPARDQETVFRIIANALKSRARNGADE